MLLCCHLIERACAVPMETSIRAVAACGPLATALFIPESRITPSGVRIGGPFLEPDELQPKKKAAGTLARIRTSLGLACTPCITVTSVDCRRHCSVPRCEERRDCM
jgi:hypothetical protein